MEAAGDGRAIASLVVDSAPEFRALISLLARLDGRRLDRPRPGGLGRRAPRPRSADGVRRAARGQHARRQQRRCGAAVSGLSRGRRTPGAAGGRVVTTGGGPTTAGAGRWAGLARSSSSWRSSWPGRRRAEAQPPPPELTAPVNDFAGVVDAESARALDELIRALQAASGDAVVVATVKTFKPWGDVQSYATRMFENGGRGIGAEGQGQRPARAAGGGRPPGVDRGRLRPRGRGDRRLRRRDQPPGDGPVFPSGRVRTRAAGRHLARRRAHRRAIGT